jgi:ubiquinol-cytochrome c reductase cytochrome b subunit
MTPLFALLLQSLDERLKLRNPGRMAANKVFPHHWSFLLGEVALIAFVVCILTGVYLTMFYRPTIEPVLYTGSAAMFTGRELPAAFESVVRLTYDVPGGLFFRRVHRAAAHLFVAAVVLHMLRILFTGAFRRPREINYHLGILLLLLTFAIGFTGYSLPYDALAGTGIRIAYSELLSVPYVGEYLAFWIFGGEFPTGAVIPRFFVFHVLVLPVLIATAVGAHLAFVVRQRHTQFPRRGIDGHRFILGKPLWPSQFAESTTLVLWIGGVLAASAVLVPWADITLQGPYVPGEIGNNAQPEWYLFWLEGALRIFPPLEVSLLGTTISAAFVSGALLPGLVIGTLVLYPFLERRVYALEGDWHVLQNPLDIPLRAAFLLGTFSFLLILSAAATNDILSRLMGVRVETLTWAFRIAAVALPPLAALAIWRHARRRLARRGAAVPSREAAAP